MPIIKKGVCGDQQDHQASKRDAIDDQIHQIMLGCRQKKKKARPLDGYVKLIDRLKIIYVSYVHN